MKLAIVLGTRPEIIRLASTIKLAKSMFNVVLIHTGQNFDRQLNEVFFEDLELTAPDIYLDCSRGNVGETVGDIITKTYNLFLDLKPDAVLILGDTNSCLCAYSAKRLKIPIFHLEAGNRCFDPNVPEEINRNIIDHISDINVCYVEHARTNLLAEGLKSKYIFVLGSPIPEILNSVKHKIDNSDILEKYNLKQGDYFVWSSHREENVSIEKNFDIVIDSLNNLANTYKKKIIFTVHPRTRNVLKNKEVKLDDKIVLSKPFCLLDYYKLQKNAACVISDSGTVTEEASILGFKAVLLRTSTEHPEGVDAGNIVLGNIKWDELKIAIQLAMKLEVKNRVLNYENINFSEKVCKLICGYKEIVNRFIWMK